MKNSIDYSLECATTTKHDLCGENTCATCLENRGCMYEQYLYAAILSMEKSQLDRSMNSKAQHSIKDTGISSSGMAA